MIKCRFEKEFPCACPDDVCKYDSLYKCLRENIYLQILTIDRLKKELGEYKRKRMLKHSQASMKWRHQAFYYKRQVRIIKDWIKKQGLEVPKVKEMTDAGNQWI